jgi:hypothetical protein
VSGREVEHLPPVSRQINHSVEARFGPLIVERCQRLVKQQRWRSLLLPVFNEGDSDP